MDPNYRGAAAVAAATHLRWLLDHPEATRGAGFYLAWHAYAVHARYPRFRVAEMLSPAGRARYRAVTAKGFAGIPDPGNCGAGPPGPP